MPVSVPRAIVAALLLLLTACGSTPPPAPSLPFPSGADASQAATSTAAPSGPVIVPAPGSSSAVYRPNPSAITVAIDPGHGGCLDWGVPDPSQRGIAFSEKAMTLGIGLQLRDLLEAQGIGVVMTRDRDAALAGDRDAAHGCDGPPWRDVDGDGQAGFEQTGRVRTRDELQARIDLANVARADALVSIHINSPTENGVPVKIAFSETYYDDETPWGVDRSQRLAEAVQHGVASALSGVRYDRQDRGVEARAFYLIARQWAKGDSCETAGDTWCTPHRGLQEPGVLSEVGSISLKAEQNMLVSQAGQHTIAQGIVDGLASFFADRDLAVRYDALIPGGAAGQQPAAASGDGPPYWTAVLPPNLSSLPVRLTNTGSVAWPAGVRLLAGWQASEQPYLAAAPDELRPVDVAVPPLAPGESIELAVPLTVPTGARQVAWIALASGSTAFTEHGSPALQLANTANH